MKVFFIFIIGLIFAYVGGCSMISARTTRQLESIKVGDDRGVVLHALGTPDVIERPGAPFRRYASSECTEPCAERLWFENRLSLDTKAWSVELDAAGKVIHTAVWTSP